MAASEKEKQNGKTLSLIAGTTICNAHCPFCISKMTPFQGMTPKLEKINEEKLDSAFLLAKKAGLGTVLITSKGEPTLYPEHISTYLAYAKKHEFSRVELQTNAILFGTHPEKYDALLAQWKEQGLNLVAISIVHYLPEKNQAVYTRDKPYFDLPSVISHLHSEGFKVRLACVLLKGYVDNVAEMKKMMEFAAKHKVDQLTLRRMEAVDDSEDPLMAAWTRHRVLPKETMDEFAGELSKNGKQIGGFFYGAKLYEYGKGKQNVCLTTGLTDKVITEGEIRQLIYFPSGRIITDWRYDTAKGEQELLQIALPEKEGV